MSIGFQGPRADIVYDLDRLGRPCSFRSAVAKAADSRGCRAVFAGPERAVFAIP